MYLSSPLYCSICDQPQFPCHLAEACIAGEESSPLRGEMEGLNSLGETDSTKPAYPVAFQPINIFMAIFQESFCFCFVTITYFDRKQAFRSHMETASVTWKSTPIDETLDPFETQSAT